MVVSELNGKFIALVINNSGKPSKVTVKLAKAKGAVSCIESGKSYKNTDEIPLNIQPFSYAAFTGSIK